MNRPAGIVGNGAEWSESIDQDRVLPVEMPQKRDDPSGSTVANYENADHNDSPPGPSTSIRTRNSVNTVRTLA